MAHTFVWWPEAVSNINILSQQEYAIVEAFINSCTAQERSRSAAVSSRCGPGFKRVYIAHLSPTTTTMNGTLDTQIRLAVGAFVSFWSKSCPSHPRSCLYYVGQITAIHNHLPGHVEFSVQALQGGTNKTLRLSIKREDTHLKLWECCLYHFDTLTWRLRGKTYAIMFQIIC